MNINWSNINWADDILTAILIPLCFEIYRLIKKWWKESRPVRRLLGSICDNDELVKIFFRDLVLEENSIIYAIEPRVRKGQIPNVTELLPEAEGKGIAYLYNALGQVGKKENIKIVGLGTDTTGEWNCNLILLGGQSQKHFDFYRIMQKVAYGIDEHNIYDIKAKKIIDRESGYGYGIILKAENTLKTDGKKGVAFLIGGYGILGTEAAAYYFSKHLKQLGKDFSNDCFGIIVRASETAGVEAVERIKMFDVRFSKPRFEFIKKFFKRTITSPKESVIDNKEASDRTENGNEPQQSKPVGPYIAFPNTTSFSNSARTSPSGIENDQASNFTDPTSGSAPTVPENKKNKKRNS